MKKLDIYFALLTIIIVVLILLYDSEKLITFVLYLVVLLGLYFSAAIRKIMGKQKRADVSKNGFIVLITGHILITLLFFLTGFLKEHDGVVATGEFLIYLSLMILFSIVVVTNCSVSKY